MRRAAVIAVLGVLLFLLLGLTRMHGDVDEELAGARSMAELAEQLDGLARLDDAQARRALQAWHLGADMRHLRLHVVDAQGATVLKAGPEDTPAGAAGVLLALARAGEWLFPPPASFSVAWALPRPMGAPWAVSLQAAPDSERIEALGSLLGGAALLAAMAAGMLAVMHWNTRRALAPLAQLLARIEAMGHAEAVAPAPWPRLPTAELATVVDALQRLDEALFSAQQQRRALARQVLSLQEDERARLARELHDEFGQRLTALRVNAAWLGKQLTPALGEQHEALPVLREMAAQCGEIQQEIRAVLARLRPLPGDADATGAAGDAPVPLGEWAERLQALVASWQRSGGPTRWSLELALQTSEGEALPWPEAAAHWALPRDAALALYRISQEALTNVARHAQAGQATLSLHCTLPAEATRPAVFDWAAQDDGQGLPGSADLKAAQQRGNGLAGIRQRLWALGSDLALDAGNSAGRGCRLSAHVALVLHHNAGHDAARMG